MTKQKRQNKTINGDCMVQRRPNSINFNFQLSNSTQNKINKNNTELHAHHNKTMFVFIIVNQL